MTEKKPTRQDVTPKASAEEVKPPSLLERVTQQATEEVIERAHGELRMRRQLESTLLGVDPDASPAERERARRELAKELPLESPDEEPPEPLSFVEQVAWRAEQEAIDRARDEFQAQQQLLDTLSLEPPPSQPRPKRKKRKT